MTPVAFRPGLMLRNGNVFVFVTINKLARAGGWSALRRTMTGKKLLYKLLVKLYHLFLATLKTLFLLKVKRVHVI